MKVINFFLFVIGSVFGGIMSEKNVPQIPCEFIDDYLHGDGGAYLRLWKYELETKGMFKCSSSTEMNTYIIPRDQYWVTSTPHRNSSYDLLFDVNNYFINTIRTHLIGDSIFPDFNLYNNNKSNIELYNANYNYGYFEKAKPVRHSFGNTRDKVTLNGIELNYDSRIGLNSVLYIANGFPFEQKVLINLAQELDTNPHNIKMVQKFDSMFDFDVMSSSVPTIVFRTSNLALLLFCLVFVECIILFR